MKDSLLTHYDDVKSFMHAFGQEVNSSPTIPSLDIIKLRFKLSLEELKEFFEATLDLNESNPLTSSIIATLDAASTMVEQLTEHDIDVDLIGVADALTDIDVINCGNAAAYGIDIDATFDEVHRSNMSKLGIDGKPVYREDGKIMKGPNYQPPELYPILFPENGLS